MSLLKGVVFADDDPEAIKGEFYGSVGNGVAGDRS